MLKGIALFLIPFILCFSESIEVELKDITAIQDTSGFTRVLFKINLEDLLDNSTIDFAKLFIPGFLPPNVDLIFTLEACFITKDWNANNTTWNNPWVNPGGDFDTTESCLFTLDGENAIETHLDITPIIQKYIEGKENYGLILKRPIVEGNGFTQYGSQLYGKLEEAKIVILYHYEN